MAETRFYAENLIIWKELSNLAKNLEISFHSA